MSTSPAVQDGGRASGEEDPHGLGGFRAEGAHERSNPVSIR